MAQPLFYSGFFSTLSITGTPTPVAIKNAKVTPMIDKYVVENSGSGSEKIRIATFRDIKITGKYEWDANNDYYSITDTSITNNNQATTPKFFVGCQVTSLKLWLQTTVKGTPAGGPSWIFASLLVDDFSMDIDLKGGITGDITLLGAGVNGSSSSVNAWGFQTVTPP